MIQTILDQIDLILKSLQEPTTIYKTEKNDGETSLPMYDSSAVDSLIELCLKNLKTLRERVIYFGDEFEMVKAKLEVAINNNRIASGETDSYNIKSKLKTNNKFAENGSFNYNNIEVLKRLSVSENNILELKKAYQTLDVNLNEVKKYFQTLLVRLKEQQNKK